jgi:hypothetical protein
MDEGCLSVRCFLARWEMTDRSCLYEEDEEEEDAMQWGVYCMIVMRIDDGDEGNEGEGRKECRKNSNNNINKKKEEDPR